MRDYQRLRVASKAEDLAIAVYELTKRFPKSQRYELGQQLRKAAVSVGSNIAEGSGRLTDADFERFLGMAAGSAAEIQFQLGLAARLGYIRPDATDALGLAHEVKRMLWALIKESRSRRGA